MYRKHSYLDKLAIIRLLEKINEELETLPEGKLQVTTNGHTTMFRIRNETDGTVNYIPKSDMELIKMLAQKEYDIQLKNALEYKLKHDDKYTRAVEKCADPLEIYESLSLARKELVSPWITPDKEYVEKWLSAEYERKKFSEGDPEIISLNGERVRSKSEKIIADSLYRRSAIYQYERQINLDGMVLYPDFTILDLTSRKIIIWEHFGMMDNPDYARKAVKKIELYQKKGFILGVNFFVTFETKDNPLTTAAINRTIDQILNN